MKKYIEAAKSLPHARGGVSHSTPALHADAGSLPHARGGVSLGAVEADPATVSSPRSWGCFCLSDCRSVIRIVFPTLVGVFPHVGKVSVTV